MAEITKKTLNLIETFEVKRARDVDGGILKSMTAPIVDGEEQRQIISWFNSEEYLQDDKKGYLASFVVMSPMNVPLVFFSLRCGELFEEPQLERMKIGHDAMVALHNLTEGKCKSEEERHQAFATIQKAIDEGLSFDDFLPLYQKKKSWCEDEKIETAKEVTKVLVSYPAVELKLFGVNGAAKDYWKTLGLPQDMKMGETLFWLKVVDVLKTMTKYVGCQYLYLFAADKEAEGQLVKYYRVRLGFRSEANLSANKPQFDWQSQFLFQSMDDLFEQQRIFIANVMG